MKDVNIFVNCGSYVGNMKQEDNEVKNKVHGYLMHVAQSYQVITQLQFDALMNMVPC
jgi:hypothetical protein